MDTPHRSSHAAAEDCGVWHGAKLQCGKPGMVVMGTQLCESTLRKLQRLLYVFC